MLKEFFLVALISISMGGYAQEIVLENSSGDSYSVEIESEKSFSGVIESIKEYVAVVENSSDQSKEEAAADSNSFSMYVSDNGIKIKAVATYKGAPRDYDKPLTDSDRADIFFIVTSLANSNLIKLGTLKSSLENAGDRLDPVHTLQFLAYIFSQEELKAAMQNLQTRDFVWKKFIGGVANSLTEDDTCSNVFCHAQDFATKVGVSIDLISPKLKACQWEDLVKVLIKNIPRQGNTARYDQ